MCWKFRLCELRLPQDLFNIQTPMDALHCQDMVRRLQSSAGVTVSPGRVHIFGKVHGKPLPPKTPGKVTLRIQT